MKPYLPALSVTALATILAYAPKAHAAKSFKEIVDSTIIPLGDTVIALLYAMAFLFFLFGVFKFFFSQQSDEGRQKGKQFMLWGLIALTVLFAVWGIVRLLLGVLESWA